MSASSFLQSIAHTHKHVCVWSCLLPRSGRAIENGKAQEIQLHLGAAISADLRPSPGSAPSSLRHAYVLQIGIPVAEIGGVREPELPTRQCLWFPSIRPRRQELPERMERPDASRSSHRGQGLKSRTCDGWDVQDADRFRSSCKEPEKDCRRQAVLKRHPRGKGKAGLR